MEGEGGEVGCVRDGCSEDFSLVGVVASYWIGCLCLCTCVFNKKTFLALTKILLWLVTANTALSFLLRVLLTRIALLAASGSHVPCPANNSLLQNTSTPVWILYVGSLVPCTIPW